MNDILEQEVQISIMKEFSFKDKIFNLTMLGTREKPLFLVKEVADILGLTNSREAIKDFDETEKIIIFKDNFEDIDFTDSLHQDVRNNDILSETNIFGTSNKRIVLTSKGLYKLIFKSTKAIAKAFQNWVFDVIEKIRLEGSYVLKNHISEREKLLEEKNKELELELENLHSEVTWTREQGQVLYAYWIGDKKYKCGICKVENLGVRERVYKTANPHGLLKYTVKVKDPFSERIMHYIMRKKIIWVGGECFEGEFETIKSIMDIVCKFEALLASTDVTEIESINYGLLSLIDSDNLEKIGCYDSILKKQKIVQTVSRDLNPEITVVTKGKRPVDQIDKVSGLVVGSYETLEKAGYTMGVTGNAIGIAVRNQKACKGFLWRYHGVSRDEQFSNQPVIKIECYTGTKTKFDSLGNAAKDAGISTAGLRKSFN